MARKRLGEILIQAGVLDETRLRVALREQQRWGGPLGRTLIEMRLVKEDDLVRALSVQLNIPIAVLKGKAIAHETLDLVTVDFCEEHSLVPFNREGRFLDVALCDPTNLSILDELRIRTRLNVRPYIIGPKALEHAVAKFYKGVDLDAPLRGSGSAMGASVAAPTVENLSGARFIDLGTNAGSQPPVSAAAAQRSAPPPAQASGVDVQSFEQLQRRVTQLEGLLARDEGVIRKLLGLLVDQKIVTREQILECLQS